MAPLDIYYLVASIAGLGFTLICVTVLLALEMLGELTRRAWAMVIASVITNSLMIYLAATGRISDFVGTLL